VPGGVDVRGERLVFRPVGGEADLVARLQDGDEAAFVALVRQYQSTLVRFAESMVGSRAVAEEVVQDTWLAVVRGVDRFESRSSLKTWLFRILANRARTAGGRERRTEPKRDDELTERFDRAGGWLTPPVPWADQADDRLVAERLARRVTEVLPELPESQRQVVILRDIEGLSATEVDQLLGISDGNQRVLLHRGRTRIRQRLEQEIGAG
jgi:RNA polymerase sigma-70 factor, ECF subfamily